MQNILRSRLTASLVGVAAVKIANDYSENKVWGAAPLNCALHSIKFADLTKGQGAIIDGNGSLIQFTLPLVSMSPPYSQFEKEQVQEYTTILRGNLVDLACSFDQVFSLSRDGTIFKTSKGQTNTINSSVYEWIWPQYTVKCDGLAWGEKIVQVDAGDHFVIARSNKGLFGMPADKVQSEASLSCIGGNTKEGTLSLIKGLEKVIVSDVKCGNEHVLALSDSGHVYAMGSNQLGQLGFPDLETIKSPREISTIWNPVYASVKPEKVKCSAIAAGDDFSLFVIDSEDSTEVLATGFGQFGQLGNGSYNQFVYHPVRVKTVSNLSEYDEKLGKVVPIRIVGLFAGSAHAGVILDNVLEENKENEDLSVGRDVYLWGQNAYGQLNIGKKTNMPYPVAPDISSESHEHSLWGTQNEKLRLKKNWTMALGNGLTLVYPLVRAHSIIPKVFTSRSSITLAQCLAAGLHLGHSPKVWNPAMNRFIYGIRHGIHIINLDHTLYALKRASFFTEQVSLRGGKILFLGTRKFMHPLVVEAAYHGKAYFSTSWKGGMLTNKERILKRSVGYDPDKVVQAAQEEEDQNTSSKNRNVQPFVHSPDLVIILDYPNNLWAVKECNYYGIPVIAICDSDCDPTLVQYPIPGNDDLPTGVELISQVLSESSRKGFLTRESLTKSEINDLN